MSVDNIIRKNKLKSLLNIVWVKGEINVVCPTKRDMISPNAEVLKSAIIIAVALPTTASNTLETLKCVNRLRRISQKFAARKPLPIKTLIGKYVT